MATTEHLSEDDFVRWTKRVEPRQNDVVFSYETRLGQAAIIPSGLRCCLGRRMALVRTDEATLLPRFFLYYFLSEEFQSLLKARTIYGSTVERLPLADFPAYQVRVPPIHVQAQVVSVLETLDRRIDLLRETNLTLESIAQALFKSWFIQCDPVRAKAEGREPEGMDAATAALFPSEFVETAEGAVPAGWMVRAVGDVVECVGGSTPDTKNMNYWSPPEFAWTTPKDLSGVASPVLMRTERSISCAGLARIGSGLLPVGTLLMSSRAPIGYLALAQIPLAINQGYIAITPGGALPPLFMLFWCRFNMEVIKARANGSTFLEISKRAFRPIPIVVPPPELVDAFVAVAQPLVERIAANERHAQTLAELRDEVLPRLISGSLRVDEIRPQLDPA